MSPSLETMQAGDSAFEVKFPLQPDLALEVRHWARANLLADPHGSGEFGDEYDVSSLYMDTADLDVFLGSRAVGRSKYRIRRYNSADSVFLERKSKNKSVVCKWRTPIPIVELDHLHSQTPDPNWPGNWYLEHLIESRLHPVCEIRYHRTARIGKSSSGTIRLTMDTQIRALPQNTLGFHSTAAAPIRLGKAPVILELKYAKEMPVLFKQLVQKFRLQPRLASKYKLAVLELDLAAGLVPEAVLRTRSEQLACSSS
ncbi:MAG TPA: polyphosphate polymerase domain-containing protein [Bryobacteraceae bacterium]|nr:polyphosphate polymerase domain-containing protein [Bryobacteraceae bacterium]